MRTRTRLTTPPGVDPEPTAPSRTADEVYVPGLALPEEPSVPGRHRRLLATLLALVVLLAVAFGVFRVMTAGQTFDPALDPGFAPTESTGVTPSGGLPGEG